MMRPELLGIEIAFARTARCAAMGRGCSKRRRSALRSFRDFVETGFTPRPHETWLL